MWNCKMHCWGLHIWSKIKAINVIFMHLLQLSGVDIFGQDTLYTCIEFLKKIKQIMKTKPEIKKNFAKRVLRFCCIKHLTIVYCGFGVLVAMYISLTYLGVEEMYHTWKNLQPPKSNELFWHPPVAFVLWDAQEWGSFFPLWLSFAVKRTKE